MFDYIFWGIVLGAGQAWYEDKFDEKKKYKFRGKTYESRLERDEFLLSMMLKDLFDKKKTK